MSRTLRVEMNEGQSREDLSPWVDLNHSGNLKP